jgi:hypothetical protein
VPRKAAPLFFAAIALAILACIAWIKWNERGSEARLRADLEERLRHIGSTRFVDCDLTGLHIRNLKVDRNVTPFTLHGEVVIPRRQFATLGVAPGEKHSFPASGTAVFDFVGNAMLERQKVATAPFLGAVHPVWAWTSGGPVPQNLDAEARFDEFKQVVDGDANALFDLHFTIGLEGGPDFITPEYIRPFACPELRRSGRLEEAAAIMYEEWGRFHNRTFEAGKDERKEATALLRALEKAGPGHEKAIAQMRNLLQRKPAPRPYVEMVK